ncbi:hypothetical protein [Cognatishimia sp. MH4019]|uniref:hypothetical protein n=1 Tax=Cognatishimia sp. MH4019 TaxID=2854030 RepID=UPI001CD4B04A|nr:hypothetical protein [Cognatishimia sp. MH4019]
MDKQKFYAALRKRNSGVFGTSFSQAQVDGIEAILAECVSQAADLGQTAYVCARAYGETGGKMQPVEESLWYSEKRLLQVFGKHRRQGIPASKLARNPKKLANVVYGGHWGRANLGNTEPNDGWDFRGRGLGQITGRRNYTKWSQGLGLPLISQPDLLMDLKISVKALVVPMLEGWATGLKLSEFIEGSHRDYLNANAVWNGNLDADKYAAAARAFDLALTQSGYAPRTAPAVPQVPERDPAPVADTTTHKPAEERSGGWSVLLAAILSIFRRKS